MRPRILLAKIGLDGHDRGVKVLARSFRDAGLEVIYTGLWQTCEATMHAAMQEDVDVVGVSLLSAAHMTVMPELLKFRRDLGLDDVPVVLGGIVPETDHQPLKEMGVAGVFNPGSHLEDIITALRELVAGRPRVGFEQARAGYDGKDGVALARLITCLQRGQVPEDFAPPKGHAAVIGVTGAPGVGKSSFIGKLADDLRARRLKVAVVATDPSSPVTGGALLGDRLRMMHSRPDPGFFVRSLSSGETLGGLGPQCAQVVALLDGYGFDVILLETVGAGQSDVAVRTLAEHTLLLLMPQSGDSIQFSKAGIMEIASGFVLNKCDLEGADATEAQLKSAVGDARPVWRTSTTRNEGIEPVGDWVAALARSKVES
ncbi:MAG TPA: cobalamin-dependent protein [Phycisphaerae bacterium]|nr:cobalamin-dependent protein [Phycisphaerae bacterium]